VLFVPAYYPALQDADNVDDINNEIDKININFYIDIK